MGPNFGLEIAARDRLVNVGDPIRSHCCSERTPEPVRLRLIREPRQCRAVVGGSGRAYRNTIQYDWTCRSSILVSGHLHERGDGSRHFTDSVPWLRRILLRLEGATRPET